LLASTCAYGYLFETPLTGMTAVMRKGLQAPHPFVFEPERDEQTDVRAGEIIRMSLVLIGDAIRYLPHVFLALDELGRQGLGRDRVGFHVARIAERNGSILFDRQAGTHFGRASAHRLDLEPGPSAPGRFTVLFRSATRIVVDSSVARTPTLEDIVKTLCRRVFLLKYFHDGGSEEPLSSRFVDAARDSRIVSTELRWADADRFSTRQQRSVPIGGIVGRITVEADLGVLRPLLHAGEWIHVGKNATFGLGQYEIREGEYT
jgi:hypothetical protein